MEKATAVNTCLGVLKGRDCIYLDQVKQDALNNLTFTGDINGHLISQCRDEKDWFPYTLTFRQVLAYFTCELDTYENMAGTEYLDGSSFDLIAEMTDKNIKLQDLQKLLKEKGAQLNVDIKAQHEDIFNAMHTIG